jgi:hypothetical protein
VFIGLSLLFCIQNGRRVTTLHHPPAIPTYTTNVAPPTWRRMARSRETKWGQGFGTRCVTNLWYVLFIYVLFFFTKCLFSSRVLRAFRTAAASPRHTILLPSLRTLQMWHPPPTWHRMPVAWSRDLKWRQGFGTRCVKNLWYVLFIYFLFSFTKCLFSSRVLRVCNKNGDDDDPTSHIDTKYMLPRVNMRWTPTSEDHSNDSFWRVEHQHRRLGTRYVYIFLLILFSNIIWYIL